MNTSFYNSENDRAQGDSTANGIPVALTLEDYSGHDPYVWICIHGSWMRPLHWSLFRREVILDGHGIITPELDASNPNKTFDDDARVVLDAIDKTDKDSKLVIIGHSRGGEAIPRVKPHIDPKRIAGLVFLNNGGPLDYELPDQDEDLLQRYQKQFIEGIIERPTERITEYRKEMAPKTIFNCLRDPDTLEWAVGSLRPQRIPVPRETELPALSSDLPRMFILGRHDRVHNATRATRVAEGYVGTTVTYLKSDHVPQLSRPRPLLRTIKKGLHIPTLR